VAPTKRRSITWQQALLLLVFGVVAGYPSFEHLDIWSKGPSPIALLGFFAGLLAFIAGCIGFLWIAVRVVTSPSISDHTVQPRSSTGAIPSISLPRQPADASINRHGAVPGSAALSGLCIALVAGIGFVALELVQSENRPSHTSMFGRDYLLHFGLSSILSQLPYAVALIRIWKEHDRAGIALAGFVGAIRIFATLPFFAFFRYPYAPYDFWPWLNASLGLAVVAFAILAWRGAPSRDGEVGLLISLFFGLLIYTAVSQLTLQILWSRVRL
jgi:hypothetical protein